MSIKNNPQQGPKSEQNQRLGGLATLTLCGLVVLAAFFFITKEDEEDDPCDKCSICINADDNSQIVLDEDDIICIEPGVTFSGEIIGRVGNGIAQIVNFGTFNPSSVKLDEGEYVIENHGEMSPSLFETTPGIVLNFFNQSQGSFTPQSLILRGADVSLHNYGQFEPGDFTFDNQASFYNYSGALSQLPGLEVNDGYILNEGSIWIDNQSLTLNTGSSFDNEGELTVGTDFTLNQGTTCNNYGQANINRFLVVNEAQLTNRVRIQVSKSFTINEGGEVENTGDLVILKNLVVNGSLAGSNDSTLYGVVTVYGVSTVNGTGSLKGYIDVCDQGSPAAGLDQPYGSIGSEVTYCKNTQSGASTFPIELTLFQANIIENQVVLSWQTAQETNNHYFNVERRGQSNEFQSIGRVEGAGNSQETINYEYLDDAPFSGTQYYRLKQTDYDGQFSYSSVIELSNLEQQSQALKIYPNPVLSQATLILNTSQSEKANIQILTPDGKTLHRFGASLVAGSNEVQLPVGNLSTGSYLLSANDSKGRPLGKVITFIKQ